MKGEVGKPGTPYAPYASSLERYAASLKDRLFAGAVLFLPLALFLILGWEVTALLWFPSAAVMLIAHEIIGTAIWGQTVGKRMQAIKVVRADDGRVPGFGRAVRRFLWKSVVWLPIGIVTRADRRSFYDLRSGTVVVQVHRRKDRARG